MKVIQVKNKSVMDSIEDKKFKVDCFEYFRVFDIEKTE